MRKLRVFPVSPFGLRMVMAELLFVYGTLRQGDPSGRRALLGDAPCSGSGRVAGRLFNLGAYPGAVPGEGWIVGELYEIEDFTALDAYEGCDEAVAQPWEYQRAIAPVFYDDGREDRAWIYWYAWPTDGREAIPIPVGDWLESRPPTPAAMPGK